MRLTGQIRVTTIAQKALNQALRANPIGLIVSAIGVLVLAFSELFKRNETFRNSVLAITDQIKDFLFNNEALQSSLSKLGAAFSKIIKVVGAVFTVLAGLVAGIVEFIVESGLLDIVLNRIVFAFQFLGLSSDFIYKFFMQFLLFNVLIKQIE